VFLWTGLCSCGLGYVRVKWAVFVGVRLCSRGLVCVL